MTYFLKWSDRYLRREKSSDGVESYEFTAIDSTALNVWSTTSLASAENLAKCLGAKVVTL